MPVSSEDRTIRIEIAPHNRRTAAVAYVYQDGSARFDTLNHVYAIHAAVRA
jgi:hypothetical protein